MTTVTRIAGHIGMVSWKTSTSAQASAMKTAAKTYFSIAIFLSGSAVQLLDPVGQIGDLTVQVDAQADEDRDGHGEDTERDPEKEVPLPRPHLRLVRRLGSRRQLLRHLDGAFDLGAKLVDHLHQLELAAPDAVLALQPEQQALIVDAQHVGPAPVAPDLLQAGEEALAREGLVEELQLQQSVHPETAQRLGLAERDL